GAGGTDCIVALLLDGKALQAGTAHFVGQNSAEAFEVKFMIKGNQMEMVWATRRDVITMMVVAVVMAHSGDQGLIIQPKIAPLQVVIVPIFKGEEQKAVIDAKAQELMTELRKNNVSVKYDDNDNARPGWKFAEYEMKGVPVRITIGARDLEKNQVEIARRD